MFNSRLGRLFLSTPDHRSIVCVCGCYTHAIAHVHPMGSKLQKFICGTDTMTASSATTTTDDDGERAVGLQWCREVFSAKSRTKAIAINGMCFIGRLRCLFSWPVIFYGYFTSWLLTFCSGRELTHTQILWGK